MALVRLTGLKFGVYVCVSETDVVALLLAYVLWSDVCETVARGVSLDNVIGSKEVACNFVNGENVEILVEFVAVTDVVIRDEVAFSVVTLIWCRWCVLLFPVVSNGSVAYVSGFSVNFLLFFFISELLNNAV